MDSLPEFMALQRAKKRWLVASKVMFLVALVSLSVFMFLAVNIPHNENNGIIILDGYEHAVIVCGEGMTINTGHYQDPEIGDLVALGIDMCPKAGE